MIYNVTRGPVIRRENPEISITEVSKLIGEEWRNLTDGQKAPFQKKADEAKIEYQLKVQKIKAQSNTIPKSSKAPAVQATPAANLKAAKKTVETSSFSSSSLSSVDSNKGGHSDVDSDHDNQKRQVKKDDKKKKAAEVSSDSSDL